MPFRKRPGKGSKAFFPKRRAKRIYPRQKTWPQSKEPKPLGFAGYKAGMTHVMITNTNPNSTTKGQIISRPVTILECPPISIFGFRCYTGNLTSFDVFSENFSKNLSRKLKLSKTPKKVEEQLARLPKSISKITLMCHTNPVFKKSPEIFEIAMGGNADEQLKYAKELLGKEIKISDVFKEGDLIDIFAVTKGRGFEGPVKRFGVKTLGRKFQMMSRHTGALGMTEPGKVRSTVPQSGQTGFQTRYDLNKRILKITNGFVIKGGIINYGDVKSDAVLLDGCIPGSKKRLVRMRVAMRPKKTYPVDIKSISTESKQGI
jgi:large subunit ribosomal protein L3